MSAGFVLLAAACCLVAMTQEADGIFLPAGPEKGGRVTAGLQASKSIEFGDPYDPSGGGRRGRGGRRFNNGRGRKGGGGGQQDTESNGDRGGDRVAESTGTDGGGKGGCRSGSGTVTPSSSPGRDTSGGNGGTYQVGGSVGGHTGGSWGADGGNVRNGGGGGTGPPCRGREDVGSYPNRGTGSYVDPNTGSWGYEPGGIQLEKSADISAALPDQRQLAALAVAEKMQTIRTLSDAGQQMMGQSLG